MTVNSSTTPFLPSERFSVAPMVDVTDSVFRRMARVMSQHCMLYTEMIAAEALVHEKYYLIDFKDEELPCCLQLGSADPKKLAVATKVGVEHGYSAINLNAGCPSDKVQSGNFGAILMKTPELIAQCYQAMAEAAGDVPVSVKTRIGVDELDSEEFTFKLMGTIYEAGCRHIIIHARKAWLNGLSPKENRTIPPLDYERVYKIKAAFPELKVTINGGITTMEQCQEQLTRVDGVMLGRAIIDNPYLLATVDQELFAAKAPVLTREEVLGAMVELGAQLQSEGKALHFLCRHLLGLFNGCANSRLYRRYLSEHMTQKDVRPDILLKAHQAMVQGTLEV
ncbi:MAG: tRNA dihydrouridine(20/20a) synthase DusA [Anaerobiospirillum sp.]|nr:tRNA dihydrouridine(20/20a) synthase DusA [Anaerobiospirillum sp.]